MYKETDISANNLVPSIRDLLPLDIKVLLFALIRLATTCIPVVSSYYMFIITGYHRGNFNNF